MIMIRRCAFHMVVFFVMLVGRCGSGSFGRCILRQGRADSERQRGGNENVFHSKFLKTVKNKDLKSGGCCVRRKYGTSLRNAFLFGRSARRKKSCHTQQWLAAYGANRKPGFRIFAKKTSAKPNDEIGLSNAYCATSLPVAMAKRL
ncbi:hypothetical protein V8J88_16575 [Massilia sp. W12]|uniref:hypothetical protein n=1 Tax=Massilia sp. W12 TaxID=3126507 RepID=UPI0030D4F7D7